MVPTVTPDADLRLVGEAAVLLPVSSADRRAVLAAASSPFLPHKARTFVGRVCERWQLQEIAETAMLVADELVTNAVVHARTPVELHLSRAGPRCVVAVHDRNPAFNPSWWDREPDSGD